MPIEMSGGPVYATLVASFDIDLGVSATGATAASGPSTSSPMPCSITASGRWPTGFLPHTSLLLAVHNQTNQQTKLTPDFCQHVKEPRRRIYSGRWDVRAIAL